MGNFSIFFGILKIIFENNSLKKSVILIFFFESFRKKEEKIPLFLNFIYFANLLKINEKL